MKRSLHAAAWKCLAFALLTITGVQTAQSQPLKKNFFEAGITVGPSNFLGDLGGTSGRGMTFLKDNNFPTTKLMGGAFITYHPNAYFGIRLAANIGQLAGDDALIKGKGGMEEARKIRNANFKSNIQEVFVAAEIYPSVILEGTPDVTAYKFRPYALIGVGAFHFNPQGKDLTTGQWINLRDLRTEGQGFNEFPDRKVYKLTQINIPMGVGVKYYVSERLSMSLEIVHRKTFTDYIDDVSTTYIDPALYYNYMSPEQAQYAERLANKTDASGVASSTFGAGDQRGNPYQNDSYYSVGFKVNIKLGNADRWRNSTRCPIRF